MAKNRDDRPLSALAAICALVVLLAAGAAALSDDETSEAAARPHATAAGAPSAP